ncbi:MAG: tRNA 2-thiouridine(34) synthase MnmA [Alphaproteobacteria bacterium]|jgi:tRNA-specific 2-thiouridylase|nr:tRNA 2-thiouridine(34) synthase MnmA [Alphaproteobacteria bacterium]
MKKIAVAMSGGVDSTVAVVLLKEQGYEVIGITLDMIGDGKVFVEAKKLAKKMNIEHHAIDISKVFEEKIIDYFVKTYKEGKTPTPCVMCNRFIKFGLLADKARELGCEKMATGHYVIKKDGAIYRAADGRKDQTYFLFNITQEQIDFCEFPLGEYTKPEIIKIAEKHGVRPSGGESQDICFVEDGKYAEFIKERSEELTPVDLIDTKGDLIKKHKSIIHYTIGQRKGLDIGGLKEPQYVVKIDADKNQVTVGNRNELAKTKVYLSEINWLGKEKQEEVFVKLRYAQPLRKARIDFSDSSVLLEEPDYAVAPGQACVFYGEDGRLLGGGFIV